LKPKILIVDDERVLLTVLIKFFQKMGFEVYGFDRANEALEKTNFKEINIALVDVLLPDLNGIELAKYIVKANPRIPILFMTAYDKNLFLGSAMDSFQVLHKPFESLQEVFKAVSKQLGSQFKFSTPVNIAGSGGPNALFKKDMSP